MSGGLDHAVIRAGDLPLAQIANPAALALIRRTDGPAYRPVGAAMIFGRDGEISGNLSSGCIDADIAVHARRVIATNTAQDLRYGLGSRFMDLVLPCGGGLDIRILPLTCGPVIETLREKMAARDPADIWFSPDQIGIEIFPGADFRLRINPDIRFVTFGKGPEVVAFSRMTAAAGYETFLASPDDETLALTRSAAIQHLPFAAWEPRSDMSTDRHTAVTLFFHHHDYEAEILRRALESPAFYIGAQGSRRTAALRLERLRALGVDEVALLRLRGPIGLIPSTRDARTLAVSVLAEILAESGAAE